MAQQVAFAASQIQCPDSIMSLCYCLCGVSHVFPEFVCVHPKNMPVGWIGNSKSPLGENE